MAPPRSLKSWYKWMRGLRSISFPENPSPFLGLYEIPLEHGFSTLALLTFGARSCFAGVWAGSVSCRGLVTSLTSTHSMPVGPTSIPLGIPTTSPDIARFPPPRGQHCPLLKITGLEKRVQWKSDFIHLMDTCWIPAMFKALWKAALHEPMVQVGREMTKNKFLRMQKGP